MATVYILQSKKLDRFYIGFTTEITARLEFHRSASTNKYTGKADDWELYFVLDCATKNQGLLIEKHIKKMKSRVYIENLRVYPELSQKLLSKYKDC